MIAANTILFTILFLIAVFVEIRLFKSKDRSGLRKRLMGYFFSEVWLTLGFLILECMYGEQMKVITQYVIFILFAPKLKSKISFFLEILKYD